MGAGAGYQQAGLSSAISPLPALCLLLCPLTSHPSQRSLLVLCTICEPWGSLSPAGTSLSLGAASTALPCVLSLGHLRQEPCPSALPVPAAGGSQLQEPWHSPVLRCCSPALASCCPLPVAAGSKSCRFWLEMVPSSHSPAQDTLSLLPGGFITLQASGVLKL